VAHTSYLHISDVHLLFTHQCRNSSGIKSHAVAERYNDNFHSQPLSVF